MGPFVKVFEIKRIIFDLVQGTCGVFPCSDLELNHEDDAAHNEQGVGPLTHPRDIKFQKEVPGRKVVQASLKKPKLFLSRPPLLPFQGMIMPGRQDA